MKHGYYTQLLTLEWTKGAEYVTYSGNVIRTFTSSDGFSAVLIGRLEYDESDILSKPILVGSFILLPPFPLLNQLKPTEYDDYDVLTLEDITEFLIEKLDRF